MAWHRNRPLAAIVLAGLCLLALNVPGVAESESTLAPLFELPNLDGEEISLIDYRGRVVILDFWATWCHICVETFPEIQTLSSTYEDQGTALLVVSLDKSGDTSREYLIEHGYPTDNVLWGSLSAAREIKDLFGVVGIAHTIVIDRDGYIRYSGHPRRLGAELIEHWLASPPRAVSDAGPSLHSSKAAASGGDP